jgi:RNA polymerase sigma factor (sigma-70 family)
MPEGANGDLIGPLRRLVPAPQSDGELLERFRSGGDGAAFAELVRRHGPMVLGVCRRAVSDDHLAEDAFQATFLVLARRANAIGRPDRLGPWLFGVARRTARRAQALAARQPDLARTVARAEPDPADEAERRDLGAALQSEVEQLPASFREAIELCYRDGHSKQEAADRLGCSAGTVSSRLARGRALLRRRLAGRGWAPAGAAVPAALAASAARAAALVRAGRAGPAAGIPQTVWDLSEGVIRMMGRGKRTALVGLVLSLAAATGLGALAQTSRPGVPAGGDGAGAAGVQRSPDEPGGQGPRAATEKTMQAELKKLQGEWYLAGTEGNPDQGDRVQERTAALRLNLGVQTRWVVNGNTIAVKPGRRTEITFTIDPTKSPKWIDLIVHDRLTRKSYHYQGIYESDGKNLRTIITPDAQSDDGRGLFGEPRPDEFEIDPDSRNVLLTFQRAAGGETGFVGFAGMPGPGGAPGGASMPGGPPAAGGMGMMTGAGAAGGAPGPGGVATSGPGGGSGDDLRREVERLRLELRRAVAEIELLKAEIALLKAQRQ